MALTSQQFNKLATKKDLKKEVSKLATKEELKKEVSKLATKKDLEKIEEKMDNKFKAAFDIFATKEDIKNLETKEESRAAKNEILTAIDNITKQYQEFDIGFTVNQGAHDRFEEKFIKTEKRIRVIEKKLK